MDAEQLRHRFSACEECLHCIEECLLQLLVVSLCIQFELLFALIDVLLSCLFVVLQQFDVHLVEVGLLWLTQVEILL